MELRAAEYYASIRKPKSEWKAIEDMAPQLAEFTHRTRAGDYAAAADLLERIDYNYLFAWGAYARLLELRAALTDRLTDLARRAAHFTSLGRIHRYLGQIEWAFHWQQQAVQAYQTLGDVRQIGINLCHLGSLHRDNHDIHAAIACHTQALQIFDELADEQWQGIVLGSLGQSYQALGQFQSAITCYKRALAIANAVNDPWGRGRLQHLSAAYLALGDARRAIAWLTQALVIIRQVGHRHWEIRQLRLLGDAHRQLGEWEAASAAYTTALTLAEASAESQSVPALRLAFSKVRVMQADVAAALQGYDTVMAAGAIGSYAIQRDLGLVALFRSPALARPHFAAARGACEAALAPIPELYEARYALATACVGQAVCDPNWADPMQRAALLAPALTEYHRALAITAAPGVVRAALRDLDLLRAAGIAGLEPVLARLEEALPR